MSSRAELEEMASLRGVPRESLEEVARMHGLDHRAQEGDASLVERIVRARYFSCSACGRRRARQMTQWMFCPHVQSLQASWHLRRGGVAGADFLSVSAGGAHVFCASCKQLLKSDVLPPDGLAEVCAACALDWLLEAGEADPS